MVVSYNGGFSWGLGLSLSRSDGSPIDDESDPGFRFTTDPAGCRNDPPGARRTIEPLCFPGEAQVTIKAPPGGDPVETLEVTESVSGAVDITSISHGGTYTAGSTAIPCPAGKTIGGALAESRDIGGPCAAAGGDTTYLDGTYVVRGGGAELWDSTEQFQFAYRRVRGDFTISARVASRPYDDPGEPNAPSRHGKFGLMARQDCSTFSRYSALEDQTESGDGTDPDTYGFQYQPVHGSQQDTRWAGGGAGGIKHPDYIRLTRVGSLVSGYASRDGESWTQVASHDWGEDAPCEIAVGLYVCSHAGCTPLEIQFNQVGIQGGNASCGGKIQWHVARSAVAEGLGYRVANALTGGGGSVWFWGSDGLGLIDGDSRASLLPAATTAIGPDFDESFDIGGGSGGAAGYDPQNGRYTLTSSGQDIGDGGDQFQFAFKKVQGDFDLAIEVLQRLEPPEGATRPIGKNGLMVRKSCFSDAKHCMIQIPSGERSYQIPRLAIRFQDRAAGTTFDIDPTNFQAFDYADVSQRPRFERLVRLGETIYAFLSRDGVTWEPLGSDVWHGLGPQDPLLVGFAASSGLGGDFVMRPTTIVFRVVHLKSPSGVTAPFASPIDPPTLLVQDAFESLASWDARARGGFVPAITAEKRLQVMSETASFTASSAFLKTALDDIDGRIFEFNFDVFLRHDPAATPADGMVFTVHGGTDAGLLGPGGSHAGNGYTTMGYEGMGQNYRPELGPIGKNLSRNSFSVEFDVYSACCELNAGRGEWQSPNLWHLGINSANQCLNSVAQTSFVPDIYDPAGLHCRVRYNRGLVQVWVHSNHGGSPPAEPTLEAQVLPLSFEAPDKLAICGFQGTTAVERLTAEVDDFRIETYPGIEDVDVARIGIHGTLDLTVGKAIDLDGSASSGQGGGPIASYRWKVLSGPAEVVGPADGPMARIVGLDRGQPIVVALSVDDGRGVPPAPVPTLAELEAQGIQLCAPVCPVPGYCVTPLPQPYAASLIVICPLQVSSSLVRAPHQLETSLAEGTARFSWHNPVAYDRIQVLGPAGELLQEIAGTTSSLELPAPAGELKIGLRGVSPDGRVSDVLDALAERSVCETPPPLTPAAPFDPTQADETPDLTLYGEPAGLEPSRCSAPIRATDLAVLDEFRSLSSQAVWDVGLGAGSVLTSRRLELLQLNAPDLATHLSRRLITGFTLDHDADKLEITGLYSNPVYRFGLKLTGRLMQVYPEDGNFVDEFTFPDVTPGVEKKHHPVIYYRADRDILDPNARPCEAKIPKGEYLLELYAAGGDPGLPHFSFEDSKAAEDLLIPGAPCPPYPWVKVIDLTGKRSLPTITTVRGYDITTDPAHPRARFVATGYWLDESNQRHSLDQEYATAFGPYVPYRFKFVWTIHDRAKPSPSAEQDTNVLETDIARIGCFQVDLTISDADCPRSVSNVYEVPVFPANFTCYDTKYNSILNPTPEPGSIHAVAGLVTDVPAGIGAPPGRTVNFRVFVVPRACCDGTLECDPALPGDLQFQLSHHGNLIYEVPTANIKDLCPAQFKGPKYFSVFVDLDRLPLIDGADQGVWQPVIFEGRTNRSDDPWRQLGDPLEVTNRPESLTGTHWSATFTPADDTYRFLTQSAPEAMHNFGQIPDSKGGQILKDFVDAVFPTFSSNVSSGLNSGLSIASGSMWEAREALSAMSGTLLGNQLNGSPAVAEATRLASQTPEWEWSKGQRIFERHFEQKLFEALVYSGVIVIVPVNVWASVSLALDFSLDASMRARLAPFAAAFQGGKYFQSDLGIDGSLGVSLPASIRTDILFGLMSFSIAPVVAVDSIFGLHLITDNTTLKPTFDLKVLLDLYLRSEVCVTWIFCASATVPLFTGFEMIDYHENLGGGGVGGGGETPQPAAGRGSGGAPPEIGAFYEELSSPAACRSPSGKVALTAYNFKSNLRSFAVLARFTHFQPEKSPDTLTLETEVLPEDSNRKAPIDLAAALISDSRAFLLATRSFPFESALPLPFPEDHAYTREELNELKAQDEVMVIRLERSDPATTTGLWNEVSTLRLSDPPGEVPPAARRADGRPAIAGDGVHQDALTAWVRVEDREYLVSEPGSTTVYVPVAGEGQLQPHPVDSIRPRLESAAIYIRRIDFQGFVDAPRKISPAGINVEPAVAFSPTGNQAYCVWVNDPTHKDLVTSNRGRNLLYSIWTRATDSWSAPQPVLAAPDDTPGVLEPSISLSGDGEGLLAFNALLAGAAEIDAGLGGSNRYVSIARLHAGAFGKPSLIHKECGEFVLGRWQTIDLPPFIETTPNDFLKFRNPDWVMFYQGTGAVGAPESSGNVMVSVLGQGQTEFTPPVSVTSDDRTHSSMAGTVFNGGIQTVNFRGGLSLSPLRRGGGGGGDVTDAGFEARSLPLQPDLAILRCTLSDQFPGPGALVKVRVNVTNRGLASSPTDHAGQSATGVRISYLRQSGLLTEAASAPLPEIAPGGVASVELDVEMPLDPVQLRAEIDPNPIDGDPSNDIRKCFFGAPTPLEAICRKLSIPAAAGPLPAVGLGWKLPLRYDEVWLYRDGQVLAILDGGARSFVDREAGSGDHLYEVRGRVGVSLSTRATFTCLASETFRRGDVDGNVAGEITDAISLLSFLYLGGAALDCPDAADVDDNGALEITDAINILSFLFLGGSAPADPGPFACGPDPTLDSLGPCVQECR
jgi:hypothetical protein